MKQIILAIFFLTAFQPTPKADYSVKLKKDGKQVGIITFDVSEGMMRIQYGNLNRYMRLGFDEACPQVTVKDGKPIYAGDIFTVQVRSWVPDSKPIWRLSSEEMNYIVQPPDWEKNITIVGNN